MVKNVIIVLLAIAIILLVITRQSNNTPSGNNTKPPFMETVPLKTAKEAVDRFQDSCKSKLGFDPIKSFTMRGVDAMEVLGLRKLLKGNSAELATQADTLAFRVYLGLDDSLRFKLFVVKVEGVNFKNNQMGKDVPFIIDGQSGVKGTSVGSEYVLDVNQPCPKTCPEESIL
jgi:hypothetical protein